MDKLADDAIEQRLTDVPEWVRVGDVLQRTFNFDDFVNAMAFVNRVAELAEAEAHHPDIMVRYGKVTLSLTTHDAGGLTSADFGLAQQIDELQTSAAA